MIPQLAGPDAGVAWHYGDPLREQRLLAEGAAGVDLSHRPVFTVAGPDRLSWLNNIVSQKIDDLAPGVWTQAYILDAHGHLAHAFTAVDDGETLWGSTEPGHEEALLAWLTRMRFAARAEIASRATSHALVIAPASAGGAAGPRIVP
ncbi:MAG: folate-binding protein, partial [Micropruina sp.]